MRGGTVDAPELRLRCALTWKRERRGRQSARCVEVLRGVEHLEAVVRLVHAHLMQRAASNTALYVPHWLIAQPLRVTAHHVAAGDIRPDVMRSLHKVVDLVLGPEELDREPLTPDVDRIGSPVGRDRADPKPDAWAGRCREARVLDYVRMDRAIRQMIEIFGHIPWENYFGRLKVINPKALLGRVVVERPLLPLIAMRTCRASLLRQSADLETGVLNADRPCLASTRTVANHRRNLSQTEGVTVDENLLLVESRVNECLQCRMPGVQAQ